MFYTIENMYFFFFSKNKKQFFFKDKIKKNMYGRVSQELDLDIKLAVLKVSPELMKIRIGGNSATRNIQSPQSLTILLCAHTSVNGGLVVKPPAKS